MPDQNQVVSEVFPTVRKVIESQYEGGSLINFSITHHSDGGYLIYFGNPGNRYIVMAPLTFCGLFICPHLDMQFYSIFKEGSWDQMVSLLEERRYICHLGFS
jgi:hypothetical protein